VKLSESDSIKLLAALTSAPRWVTALMLADGARFSWGDSLWWQASSAVLSVMFAGVETYAAAYMMRAWREAKSESHSRRLLCLWVATLLVLVAVMSPAVFANVARKPLDSFPEWLLFAWSICVAASTFLVVGGVGYAERTKSAPSVAKANMSAALADDSDAKADESGALPVFICEKCGFTRHTQNALNAHRSKHTANGHKVVVPEREL